MQAFKTTLLSLCTVFILAGFFGALFPRKRFKNALRNTLSIVVIATVVSSFVSFKMPDSLKNGELPRVESGELSEKCYEDYIIEKALKTYEKSIKAALRDNGVFYNKLQINTTENENGVSVESVVIYVQEKPPSDVLQKLEKQISAKIIVKTQVR